MCMYHIQQLFIMFMLEKAKQYILIFTNQPVFFLNPSKEYDDDHQKHNHLRGWLKKGSVTRLISREPALNYPENLSIQETCVLPNLCHRNNL